MAIHMVELRPGVLPTEYELIAEPAHGPLQLYRDFVQVGRAVFEVVEPQEWDVIEDARGVVIRFKLPQYGHDGRLHRIFLELPTCPVTWMDTEAWKSAPNPEHAKGMVT